MSIFLFIYMLVSGICTKQIKQNMFHHKPSLTENGPCLSSYVIFMITLAFVPVLSKSLIFHSILYVSLFIASMNSIIYDR